MPKLIIVGPMGATIKFVLFTVLFHYQVIKCQIIIPSVAVMGGVAPPVRITGAQTNLTVVNQAIIGACLPERRLINAEDCRKFMRAASEDPYLYWFGQYIEENCKNNVNRRNVSCSNSLPKGAEPFTYKTLGSRLFATEDYKAEDFLGDLKFTIDVTFDSLPGAMAGCNSSIITNRRFLFDANPSMVPTSAFFTRSPPRVTTNACSPSQLCTIILYDAAAGIRHNVFPNWPRDNPNLNDPSNPYNDPSNPRTEPNIYVWLVYRQKMDGEKKEVSVPEKKSGFEGAFSWKITDFVKENELTGPVAMTWMPVRGDLYSSFAFDSVIPGSGTTITCPALLEEQLISAEARTLPYHLGIPAYSRMFDYWVQVQFTPSRTPTVSAYADSLANTPVPLSYLMMKPALKLYPRVSFPVPSDLEDKKFTLLMANPTGVTNANEASLFLYWMAVNVPGTDLNAGTQGVSYASPSSLPVQVGQQMYILVIEQPDGADIEDPSSFLSETCPATVTNRCQFSLTRFLRDTKAKVSGLARFRITNDIQIIPSANVPNARQFGYPYYLTTGKKK